MVEWATMQSKMNGNIWKSIENWIRNWCQKFHTILLRVISLKNKQSTDFFHWRLNTRDMTGKCQGYIFSDRQNIRIRIRIYTSKLSSQVHRRRPRCGALHFAQHWVQGRRRGSVLSRLLRHEVRAHWMHPLWAGEVTQSNMFPLLFHTWPKTRHFVFAIHFFLCNQKSIKIPLRSCGLFF